MLRDLFNLYFLITSTEFKRHQGPQVVHQKINLHFFILYTFILPGKRDVTGIMEVFSKEPNPLNERLNEQNSCFRDVSFTERGKEIALRSLSSRQNIK